MYYYYFFYHSINNGPSKNRPYTLIQTGPPEPGPVYVTTANLLMHAHSEFDVMLVGEFNR